MFVLNLSVEQWIDNFNQEELTKKPTWNQIETDIRELNGKNKTLVTLGADDETYMSIGGGAGKYVVTATFDNFDFYILVNLLKPDNQIEKLVVGRQEGNYSAKMCVDLLPCLLAARTFVESGKLDTLLSWEEDK
ncbi:MAG: Imm1 family immunity protein [Rivularia sp. (in: cyanobacteria)]